MTIPILLALTLLVVHLPLAIWLSYVDGYEHRLPNKLVLAISALTYLVTIGFALLVPQANIDWLSPLVVSLVAGVIAVLISLLIPGSFGMGDAKVLPSTIFLAALLGVPVLFGAFIWICLASVLISLIIFATTSSLKSRFAFGPVLLSAPYGGLLFHSLGIFS